MGSLDFFVVGMLAVIAVSVSVLSYFLGRKITVALFFLLFVFLNPVISLISPEISSKLVFTVMQGVNFLFCGIISVILLLKYHASVKRIHVEKVIDSTYFIVFVLVVYFFYGIAKNGFVAASIYLRTLLFPIMMLYMGAWIGKRLDPLWVERFFVAVGAVAAIFVIWEFFFPHDYYGLINADAFYALKNDNPNMTVNDLVVERTRRLLNYQEFDDISFFKAAGPTFNYPSSSYLLVSAFVCAIVCRLYVAIPLLLVGIAILSTKAGFVSIFFIILAFLCAQINLLASLRVLHLLGLFYSALAIGFMMQGTSIHIYSLISSIIFLPKNLLGQGLGFGGSLTVERVVTWEYDMLVGDSGVAIALNMLGVFAILLYYYYFKKLSNAIRYAKNAKDKELYLYAVLGFVVMYNSIIQELALGPYAIGIVLFFVSMRLTSKLARGTDNAVRGGVERPASRGAPGSQGEWRQAM